MAVGSSRRIPSYRLHKPSGQAVVTLDGRDVYLGKFNSIESRAEYNRLVAEWLAGGQALPASAGGRTDRSVNELVLAYLRHAEAYYVKAGAPTSEVAGIKDAVRPLCKLYGHTPAADFGPLALKAVRRSMIEADWSRNTINKQVRRIVRVFAWAVENELAPAAVHHGLAAVKGLRKGRSDARETAPVRPVPEAHVDAVRPHVSRQVWAMIQLQLLTGMRPGEVVVLRTGTIDRTGPIWSYRPEGHKLEHLGRDRVVPIGPRGQEILRPWLRPDDPEHYLFSPREATAERMAAKRAARKTKVQPSQRDRSKPRPQRAPQDSYSPQSYANAIKHGCNLAGVDRWGPNRLRHNAATRLRREYGLDVARAILGHTSPDTTEIYAEVDRQKADAAMAEVG